MTRMTHDKMIEVIQAHKEGKNIEARNTLTGQWVRIPSPSFDFSYNQYRVAKKVVESIPYRRALLRSRLVSTIHGPEFPGYTSSIEMDPQFVGWIDEEWITSKIEVDA